jgi:hypothetical protein
MLKNRLLCVVSFNPIRGHHPDCQWVATSGGRVTWLILAQRPFCFSCFIISVIALARMWSLLCSAVSINWWRCCQQRVGALIDSCLISRSVTIIWAHIVPYVDVRGSGRFSLRQSLIIFWGLGTPTPIDHPQANPVEEPPTA